MHGILFHPLAQDSLVNKNVGSASVLLVSKCAKKIPPKPSSSSTYHFYVCIKINCSQNISPPSPEPE